MNKGKVILTGSQGFIGSYICDELLANGYKVVGFDNFSKYGKLTRAHDKHPNFKFFEEDILSWNPKTDEIREELKDATDFIACAAMIGGISYFHKYAYDLVATNERILANSFDLCIRLFNEHSLRKVTVLSSSMVYENCFTYPTPEGMERKSPPPSSTYGFQKLSAEYFAQGAWEQYNLPYTIIRPFNCIGVGEEESINESEITSGNVKLMLSHVVPDLVNKVIKGQDPLHILGDGSQTRCYTNGRDIARGIRVSLENPHALMEDFNISTSQATTVLELSKLIWTKLNPGKPFKFVSDEPFDYDVQKRIPDTSKAKNFLGFEAKITLEESLDEVIAYFKKKDEESCGANHSYTNQS
jgi:UDP-glucose 4-epimerase